MRHELHVQGTQAPTMQAGHTARRRSSLATTKAVVCLAHPLSVIHKISRTALTAV